MNSFTSHNDTTELDEQSAITAIAGDANAFEVIVQLYQRRVFGFLGRMGFDQATAADLAQDTFVRVWRHRALFDLLLAVSLSITTTGFRSSTKEPELSSRHLYAGHRPPSKQAPDRLIPKKMTVLGSDVI